MIELSWSQYFAKKLTGVVDITKDINDVLSGNFFINNENIYQYPTFNPHTACATENCVFEVEGRYYYAEKDQILVIYRAVNNG